MIFIIQLIKDLIQLVQNDKIGSVILLFLLFFISILVYKRSLILQKIYNSITNFIPFIKKDFVLVANFSKKKGNIKEILNEYREIGCKVFKIKGNKYFNKDGTIDRKYLNKIVKKQEKIMKKAKKRMKKENSFIYIGFPHVPLAFLDGTNFNDIDNPILYEYQGRDSDCLGKGFFELKKIYNSSVNIKTNISEFDKFDKEIAFKIEQSFKINNENIKEVQDFSQIITFGKNNPERWSIKNYAQIDRYQKEFENILSKLGNEGVKRIHLFATTPVSLSFSLGRMIKHYYPEIIVYNYNNGRFDWGINLRTYEEIIID